MHYQLCLTARVGEKRHRENFCTTTQRGLVRFETYKTQAPTCNAFCDRLAPIQLRESASKTTKFTSLRYRTDLTILNSAIYLCCVYSRMRANNKYRKL